MANLLLRMIIAIPLILMLILILASGGQVYEPVYNATNDSGGADTADLDGAEEAYGRSQAVAIEDAIGKFTTAAAIGLVLAVCGWLIFGSLTSDVRQRERRRL